jgi:hypothetical protein
MKTKKERRVRVRLSKPDLAKELRTELGPNPPMQTRDPIDWEAIATTAIKHRDNAQRILNQYANVDLLRRRVDETLSSLSSTVERVQEMNRRLRLLLPPED